MSGRRRQYCERVTRITSPFSEFMEKLTAWLDSAWYLWLGLAACAVLVAIAVSVARARARAQARTPHYRRGEF
jgi:hypothetical protein